MGDRDPLTAIAAASYVVTGLGYAIGTLPITRYLFYAGGWFDRRGISWVIAASVAFVALGLGFVGVGWLLWDSSLLGGVAAVILFPIVIAVSIGSLAPVPWLLEPLKLLLVLLSWGSLH